MVMVYFRQDAREIQEGNEYSKGGGGYIYHKNV